jgi:predicted DNA-binding transcriptional regulator YafY
VRADRLVFLIFLLQARGRITAERLATELGVSARTVYRDLAALSAVGVPVFTEPGPGGGCQLVDGYRFPLRGLRQEEAEADISAESFGRPAGFELARFWEEWSREFAASRSRLPVRLRVSPEALAALPEVFGDEVHSAMGAATASSGGWQELTLSFEHELAAAHRLAGFGAEVEVLSPPAVRELLVAAARGILNRYRAGQV